MKSHPALPATVLLTAVKPAPALLISRASLQPRRLHFSRGNQSTKNKSFSQSYALTQARSRWTGVPKAPATSLRWVHLHCFSTQNCTQYFFFFFLQSKYFLVRGSWAHYF